MKPCTIQVKGVWLPFYSLSCYLDDLPWDDIQGAGVLMLRFQTLGITKQYISNYYKLLSLGTML